MTILDPSARRWDVTPKRRIVTTSHRIAFDPELGARVTAAQAVQSAVYDATLEHLDRHGPVPWIVPAGGADSVLKWLTRERRQHPEWSLALARGAAQQAWMAWSRWDEGQQALAEQWATEFDQEELVRASQAPHPSNIEDPAERARHEPSPRLLRRLTREPTRCQRRGDKGAAVRLAVPCTGVGAKWHVPGVGKVTLHPGDELPSGSDVRSCQLVERTRPGTPVEKRRYRLNMQCGHEVPKGLKQGKHLGLDYGVRHTVTTSDGRYLDRPDTSELEDKGRALLLRAKTRCRRGSRQWTVPPLRPGGPFSRTRKNHFASYVFEGRYLPGCRGRNGAEPWITDAVRGACRQSSDCREPSEHELGAKKAASQRDRRALMPGGMPTASRLRTALRAMRFGGGSTNRANSAGRCSSFPSPSFW